MVLISTVLICLGGVKSFVPVSEHVPINLYEKPGNGAILGFPQKWEIESPGKFSRHAARKRAGIKGGAPRQEDVSHWLRDCQLVLFGLCLAACLQLRSCWVQHHRHLELNLPGTQNPGIHDLAGLGMWLIPARQQTAMQLDRIGQLTIGQRDLLKIGQGSKKSLNSQFLANSNRDKPCLDGRVVVLAISSGVLSWAKSSQPK